MSVALTLASKLLKTYNIDVKHYSSLWLELRFKDIISLELQTAFHHLKRTQMLFYRPFHLQSVTGT